MSDFTLNGFTLLTAAISFPLCGAWTAVVEVDAPPETLVTSGPALIKGPALLLVGTILHGSEHGGRITYRIVGGRGGLSSIVAPQDYRPTTLRQPLTDALFQCGEVLSPAADPVTLARPVDRFGRISGTLGTVISTLIDRVAPGARWRVRDDGTVWVGTDLWLPRVMPYVVTDDPPGARRLVIAGETPWLVRPGESLDLRKVERVEVEIGATTTRVVVWYLDGKEGDAFLDRLGRVIDALVQKAMRRVDYFASYDAVVIAQLGDGTLELAVDAPHVPGLSRVPIRGLPGCEVKVAPGARCVVRWDGGNPKRPYVSDFEPSALLTLTVTAAASIVVIAPDVRLGGDAALDPVMRVSDGIDMVAQLEATFAVHTHPFPAAPPGPPTGPPVGALAATPTGSLVVKAV